MVMEEEIKAALRQKAEGWRRTYEAMAKHIAKGGRCTCGEKRGEEASEFDHTNTDCPVLIYLRMARLVVED